MENRSPRPGGRPRHPAQNMPLDYECSNCKLGFTVGTHHYHKHDDGYFGQRSLVCFACGRQHVIEIPMRDSHMPILLKSMPELLINCDKLLGTKLLFPRAQLQNTTTIESRDTSDLRCHGCVEIGTLLSEMRRANRRCPNCKLDTLDVLTHWMT